MIPRLGKVYHFFDDGKIRKGRHYLAKVLNVINYDKLPEEIKWNILDNIENCPWLYAKHTDKAILCSIPDYDDDLIWFIRTKNNSWFSINVQSDWQSGILDIDGSLYKSMLDTWKN